MKKRVRATSAAIRERRSGQTAARQIPALPEPPPVCPTHQAATATSLTRRTVELSGPDDMAKPADDIVGKDTRSRPADGVAEQLLGVFGDNWTRRAASLYASRSSTTPFSLVAPRCTRPALARCCVIEQPGAPDRRRPVRGPRRRHDNRPASPTRFAERVPFTETRPHTGHSLVRAKGLSRELLDRSRCRQRGNHPGVGYILHRDHAHHATQCDSPTHG